MGYPTQARPPVEVCLPTASGRDDLQALAEVVKSAATDGTLFCAPG